MFGSGSGPATDGIKPDLDKVGSEVARARLPGADQVEDWETWYQTDAKTKSCDSFTLACGNNPAPICGLFEPCGKMRGGSHNSNPVGRSTFASAEVIPVQTTDAQADVSYLNRFVPDAFITSLALLDENRSVFCSGVLLDEDTVLTAGHCFCDGRNAVEAVLGNNVLAVDEVRYSMTLEPIVRQYDPNFCSAYTRWQGDPEAFAHPHGDLAILTLSEPVERSVAEKIFPAEPLARQETMPFLFAVGFGEGLQQTMTGAKSVATLNFAPRRCSPMIEKVTGCRAETEFIARNDELGHDTCFGDSGGPLFIRDTAFGAPVPQEGFDTTPKLVGITSRGLSSNAPGLCSAGAINVSLEHPAFAAWIEAQRKGSR